jgi:tetratricopeptide (TPR) repeat protein
MEIKTTCKECKGKGQLGNFLSKSTCPRCGGTGYSPEINQEEVENAFQKIFSWLESENVELVNQAQKFVVALTAENYIIFREASSDYARRHRMSTAQSTQLLNQNLLNLGYALIAVATIHYRVAMLNDDDFFRIAIDTLEQAILAGKATSFASDGGANHVFVQAYTNIGICNYFLKNRDLALKCFNQALQIPLLTDKQKQVSGESQRTARRRLAELQGDPNWDSVA